MKLLDVDWQVAQLEPGISDAISAVISDGDFINGSAVRLFEKAFADYVDVPSCVACANGTDALELVLEGFGISEGDEVLVPAMTFVSSSEAVSRVGATPVLVDVDATAILDFEKVPAFLSPRTRAIMVVHLYGYPADVERLQLILEKAGRSDVLVIEDAAQGHGASRRGRMTGSLGDAAAFSFYPGKNLGAFGDAGAVTTANLSVAERVCRIRNHGRLKKFDHEIVGRNSRMDSIQAAVLNVKLKHLDKWLSRRREIADVYFKNLENLAWISMPAKPHDGLHAWHQFAVEVADRNNLMEYLESHGIPTGIHYPKALPDLPVHSDSSPSQYPGALHLARHEVSLPIGEHLTNDDVEYIVRALVTYPSD